MADRSTYSHLSDPVPKGLQFLEQYADRLGQLFTAAIWPLGSVGGTANAVTAACDPALTAGLVEHMRFAITWAVTNTGGVTLSIDGSGPVPVLAADASALAAGQAAAGSRALLEYVGGAFLVIGSSGGSDLALPYFLDITASTTWTKPSGYAPDTMVTIEAWGGGGSGSSNAGGGGGAYAPRRVRIADLPSSVSVLIGAGGTAGSTDGGNNTFGSLLIAYAGGRGRTGGGGGGGSLEAGRNTSSTTARAPGGRIGGGNGGYSDSWPGEDGLEFGGGGGGRSSGNGGWSTFGGAGGGGPSNGAAGGISKFGGNGGGTDVAGSAPGGGGGSNAAGGRGEVRIWIG